MNKIIKTAALFSLLMLFFVDGFAQNCNQGDQDPGKVPPPVHDSIPSDSTHIPVQAPLDPNEIIGTVGYDALGDTMQWVSATASLPYTIYFENDPDFATAAAQRVEVRHKLHPKVSKSTFCVGTFGFGDHVFAIDGEVSSYQTRLDLIEDMGIYVDVVAGYDIVSNEAFWILQTIDPATGVAPISVDMGFLPVNDTTHRGEGFVSFTIKPNDRQCVTGDTITAQASIVFDVNDAIATNKWVNTVDALPPTTHLVGQEQEGNTILLQFTGTDDTGGCGLKQYKLYVSDNYGAYALYGTYPAGEDVVYTPEFGRCYRFFCLGEDNVGNIEAMKEEAEYEYGNYNLTLTVAASPEEGGTVTGGGYYAYGNEVTVRAQANPEYRFDNWSYNGIILSKSPAYTFTIEGDRDLVANFVYTGNLFVTQSDCLVTGWNWWSSYVVMQTSEDFDMVKEALADNASMIKSRSNGFVSYIGGWYGSLTSINNQSMYMIKMNSEETIEVTGALTDANENPITINNGWNWIGYPSNVSSDLNSALANFTPHESDVIKTRTAFATYFPSLGGWYGSLNKLTPGLGYMYKSNTTEPVEFIYNISSRGAQGTNEFKMVNRWEMPVGEYAENATMIGVIAFDGDEQRNESLVLGAFVDNHCVGQAKVVHAAPIDRYVVFLTYFGDENDLVTFRLYDEANGMEYSNSGTQIEYVPDAVVGTPQDPFVIDFNFTNVDEYYAGNLMLSPNPVCSGDKVRINLNNRSASQMKIEIINDLGVVVYTNSYHTVSADISATFTPGIYIVKVYSAEGVVNYGKLVVE